MTDLRAIGAAEVSRVLAATLEETLDVVARAYLAHGDGATVVPHSLFLRPPSDDGRRYIALPAYLDGRDGAGSRAGMKWIGSYPSNVARGVDRASSLIVLNDGETGRPQVILEGARISAARTGASAAVAARALRPEQRGPVGLVGTGPINASVLRYLVAAGVAEAEVRVFDVDPRRAHGFAEQVAMEHPELDVVVEPTIDDVLREHMVISFATNALGPHVDAVALAQCQPEALILHISLRDLTPDAILAADNIVDDADHVLRERTSLHLAELEVGHRDFIRAELAAVLAGIAPAPRSDGRPTVFSPFGLGVLDLAVAQLVEQASPEAGVVLESFTGLR